MEYPVFEMIIDEEHDTRTTFLLQAAPHGSDGPRVNGTIIANAWHSGMWQVPFTLTSAEARQLAAKLPELADLADRDRQAGGSA